MKLLEILLEKVNIDNKKNYLIDKLGSKILAAAHDDNLAHHMSIEEVIGKLITADPSAGYDFLNYIVNMYIKKQFKLEDIDRLKTDLSDFVKVRSKLKNKDIVSYKTLDELYNAVEEFKNTDVRTVAAATRDTKKGKEMLIDTPDFKAFIVTTKEAACFYGKETKWCTAGDTNNQFDHYNAKGPIIIVIARKNGKDRKFQLHVEDQQFMNERDQAINDTDIKYLSSFTQYTDFLDLLIKKHYLI